MISAEEARKISIENCKFIEKYEVEKKIKQAALKEQREIVICSSEKIPATVILLLTSLGYKANVGFKTKWGNYELEIEW